MGEIMIPIITSLIVIITASDSFVRLNAGLELTGNLKWIAAFVVSLYLPIMMVSIKVSSLIVAGIIITAALILCFICKYVLNKAYAQNEKKLLEADSAVTTD